MIICANCKKSIEENSVYCGYCSAKVVALKPQNHARKKQELASQTKKKCPYCAEEVLIEAKKCKHCGEYLNNEEESIPAKSEYRIENILAGAGIGLISGFLLCWGWTCGFTPLVDTGFIFCAVGGIPVAIVGAILGALIGRKYIKR